MKLKQIIFILSIFFTQNCVHYFIKDTDEFKLSKKEIENLSNKKISFLGFDVLEDKDVSVIDVLDKKILNQSGLSIIKFVNSDNAKILPENDNSFIKIQPMNVNGRIIVKDKFINWDNNTKQFLEFKLNKITFDFKKDKNNIPPEKLRAFLINYLEFYKHLGLNKVNEIVSIGESKNIILKNSDSDYWIIGTHEDLAISFVDYKFLSIFPCIITLGIFPFFSEKTSIQISIYLIKI